MPVHFTHDPAGAKTHTVSKVATIATIAEGRR